MRLMRVIYAYCAAAAAATAAALSIQLATDGLIRLKRDGCRPRARLLHGSFEQSVGGQCHKPGRPSTTIGGPSYLVKTCQCLFRFLVQLLFVQKLRVCCLQWPLVIATRKPTREAGVIFQVRI